MTHKENRLARESADKRALRITEARLAVGRCERYLSRFPFTAAAEVVRDCKLALKGLLEEVKA
jgi:hypothetical protein